MAEQKKMRPHPVEVTLSIIGGKWKPLIEKPAMGYFTAD